MTIVEANDADFAALLGGVGPRHFSVPKGGVERPEILQMLRDLAGRLRPTFAPAAWLMLEGNEVVGLCSLVKEPTGDGIDIGYGVAPARRRRGLASSGVGALLAWARRDMRVEVVRAETSVHNLPSQRVLERNGFVRAGTRVDDEDGALICWKAVTNHRA